MPAVAAGPEIERLIQLLARLPGLGPRSARRAALFLIKKREALMAPLAAALQTAIEKIEVCRICGNIDTQNPCTVCTDPRRDASAIIVVADVADLWALERAHGINARYHVLGGTLSPLDGVGPDDLTIDALVKRAHDPAVTEIILALNATVDGQSTAHYIADLLHDSKVRVTRLAHGVPVGGELDYLDEGAGGRDSQPHALLMRGSIRCLQISQRPPAGRPRYVELHKTRPKRRGFATFGTWPTPCMTIGAISISQLVLNEVARPPAIPAPGAYDFASTASF